MDELGSYPRMQYHNTSNYSQDADQHGSWFGLAISGLKFLINQNNNNNINHNLCAPHNGSTLPSAKRAPNEKKLHILGPSVFRKKLYDIPEYQSTHNAQIKNNARLTKQSLQQFNGNFSNYWNQRSSLHSHSHASDHGDMEEVSNAGSIQTNHTASSINYPNEEHHPSMTSSQIIHPTQDKQKRLKPQLQRSRSYPLLSCDEYIQNLQHFSRDIVVSNIPSPPPTSTTPQITNEMCNRGMMLPHIKTVHALRSSDSINSSNFTARSESDIGDGIVYNDRDACVSQIINNHFIREQRQKQWLRRNLCAMKSRNSTAMNHASTECIDSNETLQVISRPLPKSIKKKRRCSGDTEEDTVFSDWSNVSSNISANAPQTK